MSELKAISGHEIREDIDYNTRGIDPEDKEWHNYGKELCDTLYYRKSEADREIRKQKRKRCLAMKEFCSSELEIAFRNTCISESVRGCIFFRRWLNKWLELADKFKEAK